MEPSSFIIIPLLVALFCLSYIIYRKDKCINYLQAKLLTADSVTCKITDERNDLLCRVAELGDELSDKESSIATLQAKVSELQDIKPNTVNLYRIGNQSTYAYVAAARRRDVIPTIKKDEFLSTFFEQKAVEVTDDSGNVLSTKKVVESEIFTEDSIIHASGVKILSDKPFVISYCV